MKTGFAFYGNDRSQIIIPEILWICRRNNILPDAFVLGQNTLSGLLTGLYYQKPLPCTRKQLFRQLKRIHVQNLKDLQVPVLICQKELLRNKAVYFGNTLCYPEWMHSRSPRLRTLAKQLASPKLLHDGNQLISNYYIKLRHIMMGLTLLDTDRGIIFQITPAPVSNEITHINSKQLVCRIRIDEKMPVSPQVRAYFDRHLLELYEFLWMS